MDSEKKMTKKELKALRRLEKQHVTADPSSSSSKTKWIVLGGAVVLFIAFFVGMVVISKKQRAEKASQAVNVLTESGMVRGEQNAPVTIVEFADYQCPSCQAAHPIVKETLNQYKGKAKLLYKHFPLISIHPNARPAALAAEAAGKQGKFWEMSDMLYERQAEWSEEPNPQALFEEYAVELELNPTQFTNDMGDEALAKKIDDQRDEGIRAGVMGTPTFYVNGQLIPNPNSVDELKQIIDSHLNK